MFTPATKYQSKLRLAFTGPAGSGKTYSSLEVGTFLGERMAVVDTEHGSASKYANLFRFDVVEPDSFHPQDLVKIIRAAEKAKYDVLVVDSLSHYWMGRGGALELKDEATKRFRGNSWAAWSEVTPLQMEMIDTILRSNLHVIATMRSKTEWAEEVVNGQKQYRKVGTESVQREQIDYEFDIWGNLTLDNEFVVQKTRFSAFHRAVIAKPGKAFAELLLAELQDGEPWQRCEVCGGLVRPQAAVVVMEYAGAVLCEEHWLAFRKDRARSIQIPATADPS